jgi:hypothetical protein
MNLNKMHHELVRLVKLLLSDEVHQSGTQTALLIKRLMIEMIEIYRGVERESGGHGRLNFE